MKKIAIVGSGISGLSAAWLLSQKHDVTLYEKDDRLGGHSNTSFVNGQYIDTGFIVYNINSYPNLIALFAQLGIQTQETDMSFSVSKDLGALEYSGESLRAMFAQKSNFLRPRHWKMIREILRFYKEAPLIAQRDDAEILTLGEYLIENKYSLEFINDHLIPMGAAIWSTPATDMLAYPALTFIRFCENHGLLQLKDRPQWRTVKNGSQAYVQKIAMALGNKVKLNAAVRCIRYTDDRVLIECRDGHIDSYDEVVIATHADQALKMVSDPTNLQKELLGKFQYSKNLAILHTDKNLMPKRSRAWASWNYLSLTEPNSNDQSLCLTYWMNRLHKLETEQDYFVTLNPIVPPQEGTVLRSVPYEHPLFNQGAIAAQKGLWQLQGRQRMWFCGSYFGYGFHEDGVQAGLAVAELVGDMKRPWDFDFTQSRIVLPDNTVKLQLSNVA